MMEARAIYRWPRGTPLFGLIGLYAPGLLLAAQPDVTNLFAGKVGVAAYFLAGTLFCIYLFRFRVLLDATSIRSGAFFLKEIKFTEVVRARYAPGDDSGKITLWSSHGTRISIPETIHDFGACARAINARLPAHLWISRTGRTVPSDVLSGSDLV